jgi:hypothetical protein
MNKLHTAMSETQIINASLFSTENVFIFGLLLFLLPDDEKALD